MKIFKAFLFLIFCTAGCTAKKEANTSGVSSSSEALAEEKIDLDKLPVEELKLVPPPQVPPPITRKAPARVKVFLEVREQVGRMADGVDYTFWTFGGTVPGPMIRIREGDYVDFTLANHPSSKLPHNIDLHAVTGQGGGAEGSFTAPGHSSTFSFRALNPGLYIYHCATAPVGMHIGNGMYGLIYVEPREGLPKVDKEYYIVQGDFYTKGRFGERGLQSFDMEKAIKEQPEYVLFNGSVDAISGDNALTANPGEKIRLFVGNGGPNLTASFHVIGEIFDAVYHEGGTGAPLKNIQTTSIPPGGASIADLRVDTSGSFILVDHAIFRAFNKGALGTLKVAGDARPTIYTGKTQDGIYLPEGQNIVSLSTEQKPAAAVGDNFEERMKAGEIVFKQNCAACHQLDGTGIAGAFPPLAGSDYLLADKARAIKTVGSGLEGPITVNGKLYNSVMPALSLSDDDVANVVTYVLNSWGNKGGLVTLEEARKHRK